ncbi:hypothetical protein RchiOBHm_Chr1g0366981 [Rosa chinensis]|uniref:Uncharacterized protein n=1 Tax=Rosa chinensis TaxID=74649 RepID=A0A2P6SKF6_ROSCH|nr:hypothetical protein RchiOBHm_Chr1g0366981 [Rosa chinensis]
MSQLKNLLRNIFGYRDLLKALSDRDCLKNWPSNIRTGQVISEKK